MGPRSQSPKSVTILYTVLIGSRLKQGNSLLDSRYHLESHSFPLARMPLMIPHGSYHLDVKMEESHFPKKVFHSLKFYSKSQTDHNLFNPICTKLVL